jgi:large repetitive protein
VASRCLAPKRGVLGGLVVALVASTMAVAPIVAGSLTAAQATTSGSLAALTSSSSQTNGEVRSMVIAHGDVFMGGAFTSVRPSGDKLGKGEQPATYFAALNASTGTLDPHVAHDHSFTGGVAGTAPADQVFTVAASPSSAAGDGTIYVGGAFTAVDGLVRNHIAAFDAATGALLPWNPNVSGKVSVIATSGNTVYIGGTFGKVGTTTEGNLAAVDAATGAVMTNWVPSANNTVDALAVTSDNSQVVAGGFFTTMNGASHNKAAILGGSSTSGAPEPMPADTTAVVPANSPPKCVSNVKAVVISGPVAYLANEGTGHDCFDGTWAVTLKGGTLKWVNRCLGATQALAVIGNFLYKGAHVHDCQSANKNGDPANFPQVATGQARHLLSENLSNGFLGPWYPFPNAGPALGPRTMATDGHQLYVGGDFTQVNHKGQEGIARFKTTPDSPTPTTAHAVLSSTKAGIVHVTATAPVDLDNPVLTLQLFRVGAKGPIASRQVTSYFWKQPTVHWTIKAVPGSLHTYRVRALPTFGGSAGPQSFPEQIRTKCASTKKVEASYISAASHVTKKSRHVTFQVCGSKPFSAQVELLHSRHVVAKKLRRGAPAGLLTVRLKIPRRVHSRVFKIHVVLTQGGTSVLVRRKIHVRR